MIQRIQTIFLFLLIVAMVLVLVFPIWQQVDPGQTQLMTLTAWSLTTVDVAGEEVIATESKVMVIGILALISIGMATLSIFSYNNRAKQMMINMFNSLAMVANVGLIVWFTYSANAEFNPQVNGAFVLGFWAIFAALVMNMLANRFIRKDEKLVRSVDRIR